METIKPKKGIFQFKQFSVQQDKCTMKVGTDGVLLGAWASVDQVKNALDIGTGTGLISLMLAQRMAEGHITAIEIDEKSAEQARQNSVASPWKTKINVVNESIQDYSANTKDHFDLIVCNPPFFSGGTFSSNQDRNNVRHTVKLPNGDLLAAARNLLQPHGKFCVILPFIEGLRFKELACNYNLYCTAMTEVYPKAGKPIERLLMQFEHQEKAFEPETLIIQKEQRNDWTAEYIQLTGAFYLNM